MDNLYGFVLKWYKKSYIFMDIDLILLLINWYDWMIDFFDRIAQSDDWSIE